VQVAPLHRAAAVLASQPENAWHTITWRWIEEPAATQTQLLPAAATYP
jgi:hypothetical protein